MEPLSSDAIRPVGVIGAGHSGTTIVYRMLALHPDATWFSQYSQLALTGPPGLRTAAAALDGALRRRFPHDWKKVQRSSGWRRGVPTPIEGAGLWDGVFGGEPAAEVSVLRIRSIVDAACAAAGRRAIVVKPPGRYRSRCAPLISEAYPRSAYLHVARDGRAVALSVLQKWTRGARRERTALLTNASDHWRRALRQIREYEQDLPVETIRYEALCADVHGQLRRALTFAGLDADRFPYHSVPSTLTSTNAARLKRAGSDELAALDRLLADDLQRYGYASDLP